MVDYAYLSVSETNFKGCSSGKWGGAVYWYYGKTYSGTIFTSCLFRENTADNGADFCVYTGSSTLPSNPFDSNCLTYNNVEYPSGLDYSSGRHQYKSGEWLKSLGTTCPSNSGGEGDVDDVTLPQCETAADPTPVSKTLYVSTDGAETSNCGKDRESDPKCCYWNNTNDCISTTTGCPKKDRYSYNYKYPFDSCPCISISKAISSTESSPYDWNKVILMESSGGAHQSDASAIAVAAKKVWITG